MSLKNKLESKKNTPINMLIGADGFVDTIISVVDTRRDYETYTRIETIKDFGERIVRASGLSTNMEMVPTKLKLGGNGPILTNALLEMGAEVTYVGALGKPDIHQVFAPMVEKAKAVYSIADPGFSDAVEFGDGKIIFGKLSSLKDITWESMKEAMGGAEGIAKTLADCQLFGLENWTMLPYMSEIFEGIIKEVFPLMTNKEKPYVFFDLADPEKREASDIKKALELIGGFEAKFKTILGLNEKEVYEIGKVLGISKDGGFAETVKRVAEKLNIYCLVAHPVQFAGCVIDKKYYEVEGPYCEKPVLTTGAGDNFNAGFVFGQVLGLDPEESLTLAVSTSGFYVRNGKSPTFDEVTDFVGKFINKEIK